MMRRLILFGIGLLVTLAASQSRADQLASSLTAPFRLNLLEAAREIDLDMSRAEVLQVLRERDVSAEIEGDLPPDGLVRMLLAVPAEDDCLPRGAPFMCPSIRVHFLNDPQRGLRVMRIEAFQLLSARFTVSEVFAHVGAALGPPLQTASWPEQIRGGTVNVWRQRWQDGVGEGPTLDILAIQDNAHPAPSGFVNPSEPAIGVGYVRAAPEMEEGSFASVRRRLLRQRGG